jgi:hypothetical protein
VTADRGHPDRVGRASGNVSPERAACRPIACEQPWRAVIKSQLMTPGGQIFFTPSGERTTPGRTSSLDQRPFNEVTASASSIQRAQLAQLQEAPQTRRLHRAPCAPSCLLASLVAPTSADAHRRLRSFNWIQTPVDGRALIHRHACSGARIGHAAPRDHPCIGCHGERAIGRPATTAS